jgi:hypothetical protein
VPASASSEWGSTQREKLREVVHLHPVAVEHALLIDNAHHDQVESLSYRFEMSNGLSATGVWLKETPTKNGAPMTIVLNDGGKKAAGTTLWGRVPEVASRMECGQQVLVADLVFTGDAAPSEPTHLFSELLAATGERPLGMEAAQLISLAHWAQNRWSPNGLRLETTGIRSQTIALVAAALEPKLFSAVVSHDAMHSLGYLLEKPVTYKEASDLFCLDLYKDFDLDSLAAIAGPTTVTNDSYLEVKPEGH